MENDRKEMGEQMGEQPKFNLNNQRVMLTYPTHLNKQEYIDWFHSKCCQRKICFIRLAHENGENGDYQHTHVLVEWEKAYKTSNCRFFDYNGLHPNIKKLLNKKAFEDATYYIAKEDKENADLKRQYPDWVGMVQNCDSLEKAINMNMERFSDIGGITAIYKMKKREPKPWNFVPEEGWQTATVDLNEKEPDERAIIWLYDENGNTGKSSVARFIKQSFGNRWLVGSDFGTVNDAATIVRGALEHGWEEHGVIIDLPRSAENHERMYTYLEAIKNGNITATKYMGECLYFNRPHVVVMANFLPQIDCMSKDRWEIYEITSRKDSRKLTLSEVYAKREPPKEDFSIENITKKWK